MSKRVDGGRTCLVCGAKHHQGKKWSKTPNKFFLDMAEGYVCAKHYINEHSKWTFQTKRKGNAEYNTNRRERDNKRYATDEAYRESVIAPFRKGGHKYEQRQEYKKKWGQTETAKEGARKRNKRYYDKDPERQRERMKEIAKDLSRQWTYLKRRSKKIRVLLLLTKDQFIELRTIGVCEYCLLELPATGPCIDRLDSRNNNAYEYSNCVPCCDSCNKIKGAQVSPQEMKMFWAVIRGDVKSPKQDYYSIYQEEVLKKHPMKQMSLNKKFNKLEIYSRLKNIKLSLTKKVYAGIIKNPCAYCKGSVSKQGYGLDRIKPKHPSGYCESNVNPCCPICNNIKNEFLTPQKMKIIISVIAYFRKNKRRKMFL